MTLRSPSTSLLFALPLALALVGCGGSSSDSPSGAGGAGGAGGGASSGRKVDEIPALYAEAYCSLLTSCMGPITAFYLNGEDCKTRLTKQIESGDFAEIPALVAAGKLAYDGSKVDACIAALKAGGCQQMMSRAPAACDAVFGGTGKIGDDCTVGASCGPGLACQEGAACPGKCAARGAAGAACTDDDGCESGLNCQSKKCTKPAALGAVCKGPSNPDCEPGLMCIGGDEKKQSPGVCKDAATTFSAPQGSPCDFTKGEFCAPGSFCALQSASQAGVSFQCIGALPSGAACKVALPDACPTGEFCDVDLDANKFEGTCKKVPAVGEACGKGILRQTCPSYATCVAGTCKAIQPNGGACTDGLECWSKLCKGGACAAGLACEPGKVGD